MKKLFLLLTVLGVLFTFGNGEAKSYVTDYKNPTKNIAELQQIFIMPISYDDQLELDNFAKLRIQAGIQNNFKDFPIIINWLSEGQELPNALTENQAKLIIHVTKFGARIHETEGHYEKTVTPTTIIVGNYWGSRRYYDDDYYYRRGYHRNSHYRSYSSYRSYSPYYHGVSFGIPTTTTEYIPPEVFTETNVEIRFTLQNENGDITYWIYNQENIEPPNRQVLSPDTEVAKITKDAVKKFRLIYQQDLRKLPK